MNFFYQEYTNIVLLLIFSFLLSVLIIFLSFRLSLFNPDVQKLTAYECGFDPYEDSRNVFDIRFYLVSILFIIFDLEAIYFYPFCVSLGYLTTNSLFSMIDFLLELLIGFIYIWKIGALNWD